MMLLVAFMCGALIVEPTEPVVRVSDLDHFSGAIAAQQKFDIADRVHRYRLFLESNPACAEEGKAKVSDYVNELNYARDVSEVWLYLYWAAKLRGNIRPGGPSQFHGGCEAHLNSLRNSIGHEAYYRGEMPEPPPNAFAIFKGR